MLLAGPPGIGKTTVAKALCNELGADVYVINGSDEGRFLTPSEIMRRTSLRPFRLRQLLNTKSSSSMRQTTHPMMYNSYLGRLLRNLPVTADSSSPATTRTKFLNPSIPVVPSLNLASKVKTDSQSLPTFLNGFGKFSTQKEWSTTTKYLLSSSTNTSQIGDVSSTKSNDTRWVVRLIRGFLQRFQMSR